MSQKGSVAFTVLITVPLAFVLGRSTASLNTATERSGEAATVPERVSAGTTQVRNSREESKRLEDSSPEAPKHDKPRALPLESSPTTVLKVPDLEACRTELHRVQAQFSDLERERRTVNGDPIAPRTDVSTRFQERPLLAAVQGAFKATGITGRVDTVDCAEFPCIIYGRVNGDEEVVAKLEDAKPLSVYDEDVGVMLTWSSGDQSRGQGTAKTANRSKPSEISLFAFAFYTAADKARHGDSLDRRIRSRTAELWNALHPEDP